MTLQELADAMDMQSEDANNHEFVMTHRALAVLLVDELGSVDATRKIFERIAKESNGYGLPGLTGVGGVGPKQSFLAKHGIAEDWSEWELPNKAETVEE